MSHPVAKEERSKAKDVRQGVVPQKEHAQVKRKKKERPWKVMCTPRWRISTKLDAEFVIHRAETEAAALQWIEKENRGSTAFKINREFRIDGPAS